MRVYEALLVETDLRSPGRRGRIGLFSSDGRSTALSSEQSPISTSRGHGPLMYGLLVLVIYLASSLATVLGAEEMNPAQWRLEIVKRGGWSRERGVVIGASGRAATTENAWSSHVPCSKIIASERLPSYTKLVSDLVASAAAKDGFKGEGKCSDEDWVRLDLSWLDPSGARRSLYATYSAVADCRAQTVPQAVSQLVDAAWQLRGEILQTCPPELGSTAAGASAGTEPKAH